MRRHRKAAWRFYPSVSHARFSHVLCKKIAKIINCLHSGVAISSWRWPDSTFSTKLGYSRTRGGVKTTVHSKQILGTVLSCIFTSFCDGRWLRHHSVSGRLYYNVCHHATASQNDYNCQHRSAMICDHVIKFTRDDNPCSGVLGEVCCAWQHCFDYVSTELKTDK